MGIDGYIWVSVSIGGIWVGIGGMGGYRWV